MKIDPRLYREPVVNPTGSNEPHLGGYSEAIQNCIIGDIWRAGANASIVAQNTEHFVSRTRRHCRHRPGSQFRRERKATVLPGFLLRWIQIGSLATFEPSHQVAGVQINGRSSCTITPTPGDTIAPVQLSEKVPRPSAAESQITSLVASSIFTSLPIGLPATVWT